MTNLITGIERDIVLQTLYSKSSQIILNSESEKTPIIFTPSEFSIPTNNLIFITNTVASTKSKSLSSIVKTDTDLTNLKEFTICFFYQGIAMFFKSMPKKTENGIAFIIPPDLFKEVKSSKNQNIVLNIFYTGNKKQGNFLTCFSDDSFEIFAPKVWLNFPKELFIKGINLISQVAKIEYKQDYDDLLDNYPSSKKLLYLPEGKIADRNYFPYDATFIRSDYLDYDFLDVALEKDKEVFIPFAENPAAEPYAICSIIQDSVILSPLDIIDSLQLLVVCKFLAEPPIVDGDINIAKNSSLKLLYLTDTFLILGSDFGNFPLQRGYEYPISIIIQLQVGKREIFVTSFVARVFQHNNGKTCAICRFSSISEEDSRFLFESVNNKKYK